MSWGSTSLDWSVTSQENGGNVYGEGTANLTNTFLSANNYGYEIGSEAVSGLKLSLDAGTYWLNLTNATDSSGDPIYWDENSGIGCQSNGCPSLASDSTVGSIPSESFDITGTPDSGSAAEPSSIMLLGSGLFGLATVVRRRRLYD
jgi:PEP-CTERM motif